MSSLNQLLDQTEELLLSQLQAASAYHKESCEKLSMTIAGLLGWQEKSLNHYKTRRDQHKHFAESTDRAIVVIQKASKKGDKNEQ